MGQERNDRGQSLVELLVVLPVLLIIVAGLLDLGRLYYAYVAVTDASGEGASYAAMHPYDGVAVKARAAGATAGLIRISPDQVLYATPAPSEDTVDVTVVYTFTVVTPLVNSIVPGGVIPLRAETTERMVAGHIN